MAMSECFIEKIPFTFSYNGNVFEGEIVLLSDIRHPENIDSSFLSPKELLVFNAFTHSKRKKSYLIGRFVGKVALSECLGEKPDHFSILNGISSSPYVLDRPIAITISHTENAAVAIAHPHTFSLGVDLEEKDRLIEERFDQFFNQVTFLVDQEDQSFMKGLSWVAAEALGKTLGLGLSLDIDLLAPNRIKKTGSIYQCGYTHFPMFSSLLIVSSKYVLGVCYCNKGSIQVDFFELKNKLEKLHDNSDSRISST